MPERGVDIRRKSMASIRDCLIRDEGVRLKPYRDSVGKLTIGVGRNLDDKGLTRAEAEALLDNDIRDAEADVAHRLPWSAQLDEPRRGVLVMLAFNAGIGGLLTFRKMLAAMGRGAWAEAARELVESHFLPQVRPPAPPRPPCPLTRGGGGSCGDHGGHGPGRARRRGPGRGRRRWCGRSRASGQ